MFTGNDDLKQSVSGHSTAGPMCPQPLPVFSSSLETDDTFTLTLDASGYSGGFRFRPGQFTMLYKYGVGEVPISISGDPGIPGTITQTIRAVGAVTEALMRLSSGSAVGVRGPYGSWWPVEDVHGRDVVIVAGGIGLAPLRPVLYHVAANRRDYGRVALLYGARSPVDVLYPQELRLWRDRFNINVMTTVDHAASGWGGHVGVVTTLLHKVPGPLDQAAVFTCGPEIMMRFVIREVLGLGALESLIYLSMERNMQCAIGWCGHCQYGSTFVCKDGPVYRFDRIKSLLGIREL